MDAAAVVAQQQRTVGIEPGALAGQGLTVHRRARGQADRHAILPRGNDRLEPDRDVTTDPAPDLRDQDPDERFAAEPGALGERDHDRAVPRPGAREPRRLVARRVALGQLDALAAEPPRLVRALERHARTSNPMSTAGAEWVSAPTLIKSAPARA